MFRRILIFMTIVFALTVWLPGCGYKEGVLVREPISYFWFTGNVQGAVVMIDDKPPFALTQAALDEQDKEGKVYYQTSPGKHRVVVERAGQRVVDKVLYIGNGTIQEIQIP